MLLLKWKLYLETLQHFHVNNSVDMVLQSSLFKQVLWPRVYSVLSVAKIQSIEKLYSWANKRKKKIKLIALLWSSASVCTLAQHVMTLWRCHENQSLLVVNNSPKYCQFNHRNLLTEADSNSWPCYKVWRFTNYLSGQHHEYGQSCWS